MSRAAFFDLDGTLLRENSGKLWFQRERAAGRLSRMVALEAAVWLGLYGLGLMRASTALGRAARTLEGLKEEDIERRSREFFQEDLVPLFAPGGLAAIQAHKEAGDQVVLLTSSSIYLGRCVQEHLGLDDILTMRFAVEDGRFTGCVDTLCYGPSKVTVAEEWAAGAGIQLDSCWFYTDSITDLPMLERVGRAMVVQPDHRLARAARKRGWPVLDWNSRTTTEVSQSV
jgi:HAD superfamily hydrolase (TIGR01490 family)